MANPLEQVCYPQVLCEQSDADMFHTELMGYMDESQWQQRQWDDETQRYLVNFFKQVSTEPEFQNLYHLLNDDEREKLHEMDKRQ